MDSPPEPARRLFIALYPDTAVQAAIDAQRALWQWPPRARLTRPPRIHLTLHFLGQVDGAREAALREALADVPMRRLDLVLATPQVWRNRIAVLLADEDQGLRVLLERLARQVRHAGRAAPDTAGWIPHLTIAREATGARPPRDAQPIRWQVSEFVLVWSRMAPVWRHEVLARYPARSSPH
jgi:2'-5' RNA ligase